MEKSPNEQRYAQRVAVLSGGRDKPYALGLTAALTGAGIEVDFVGGDEFDLPQLTTNPKVNFLNLRGDQEPAGLSRKMLRVLIYYWRLLGWAAQTSTPVFHILWNNKFEFVDRTLLMLFYKTLGKKIVFTAHNVNKAERDGRDTWLNRFSLRTQYRLANHLFVHTEKMKAQLVDDFGVPSPKATVIPFGINSSIPDTALTGEEARRIVGLQPEEKVILFFGNIAPYKGLEFLIEAFSRLEEAAYRLVIVGAPKEEIGTYWLEIERQLDDPRLAGRIIRRIEYVPDETTELYFKSADVLVLPYTHIFQSGVLFLAYNFGLPTIAADVGSLREEIVEGRTGYVFPARDVPALTATIERFFASNLYRERERGRAELRRYAHDRYSWSKVAGMTEEVYLQLTGPGGTQTAQAMCVIGSAE